MPSVCTSPATCVCQMDFKEDVGEVKKAKRQGTAMLPPVNTKTKKNGMERSKSLAGRLDEVLLSGRWIANTNWKA